MNALVCSSSLAASFIGGILALFAPCCVVSLLPTFIGTAAARGRQRLPITALVFAAGVAAVLLPVVLGVGALGQVFAAQRRIIFLLVGIFLAVLGGSMVSGRQWMLPMPALRVQVTRDGTGSVFVLGLVSGIASSCCAPVVVGVVALSALANSVPGALGLGLSYVFGMVGALAADGGLSPVVATDVEWFTSIVGKDANAAPVVMAARALLVNRGFE